MARVPPKWKILGLNEKHILKRSFHEIVPPEITGRSKHPYRAPIKQSLLNEQTAQHTREVLSERPLEKAGLFDAKKVARLLQKLQKTDNPSEIDNMALVGVVSSQLVHQQFIEEFPNGAACSASPTLVVDHRSEALRSAN
jgi:asparagine synthase (glutamine-hydrolysing)